MLSLLFIIFVVTLSFAVLFVEQGESVFAASTGNYSDSLLNYENIENCIENDSVIVTLTGNETKNYKMYSAEGFKEVGCTDIEGLTQFTTNYAKKIIRGDSTNESMLVETENYKKILKLNLDKQGTDNAIVILIKFKKFVKLM